MKKLLCLALAALSAAPTIASAEATLYGRVRIYAASEDVDGADNNWDLQSNSSRLGVKGAEDLGDGLSAIYQFEFQVDAADSGALDKGRVSYVGLTGGFGTFAMGRQYTPYYNTVDKTDLFEVDKLNDMYLGGSSKLGNAIAYITPTFAGFSVAGALIVAGTGNAEDVGKDVDFTNLSLDYSNGPLSAGVAWQHNDGADTDLLGLGAKYNFGSFALIGQYENNNDTDESAWNLAAEAYLGNNLVRVLYGSMDDGVDTFDQWALGFEHSLSKRTRLFAEYEDSDGNAGTAAHKRFGIGLRHDF